MSDTVFFGFTPNIDLTGIAPELEKSYARSSTLVFNDADMPADRILAGIKAGALAVGYRATESGEVVYCHILTISDRDGKRTIALGPGYTRHLRQDGKVFYEDLKQYALSLGVVEIRGINPFRAFSRIAPEAEVTTLYAYRIPL